MRGSDRLRAAFSVPAAFAMFAAVLGLGISPLQAQESAGTLVVPAGERLVMELETPLHTKVTRADDRADFYTVRDLVVGRRVVVPEGSRIRATVVAAKRAGRVRGRAELKLRFDGVVFPDGSHRILHAVVVGAGFGTVRPGGAVEQGNIEGEGNTANDVRILAMNGVGGAAIGLGVGRKTGAFYGGAVGVGVGIFGMMLERGPDLDLPRGTVFEVELTDDLVVPASVTRPVASTPAAAETTAENGDSASSGLSPRVGAGAKLPKPDKDPNFIVLAPRSLRGWIPPASVSVREVPAVERTSSRPPPVASHTLRVDVGMVMVETVVRGLDGNILQGLTAGDFRVFEDGVELPVRHFSRDELPLAVALVVDRSGSEASYMPELRRAADATLSNLKAEDMVALFSFSAEPTLVEELTTDRARVSKSLRKIRPGGPTNIVAALDAAASYLAAAAPARRRAIIMISDNQNDGWNGRRQRRLIELLLETQTTVYSLRTPGRNNPLGGWKMAMPLEPLVRLVTTETGGEILDARAIGSLTRALEQIVQQFKLRYTIGFSPAPSEEDGLLRTIEVRLADRFGDAERNYTIRHRKGYYAVDRTTAPAAERRR